MNRRFAVRLASLAIFANFGCSEDAGGPAAITVGVSVTDISGVGAVVVCVRAPVLLGSVVEQHRKIANAFDVDLRALRHQVDITFPGALNESQLVRSAPITSSSAGSIEPLSVFGRDGNTYTAVVLTGCNVIVDSDENP